MDKALLVNTGKEIIGQVNGLFDYLGTREKEKTKRQAIQAEKEVIITGIKSFIERAKDEMDQEYNFRKYILKELFPKLDKQLDEVNKRGDAAGEKLAQDLINSITTIAINSPLKHSSLKHFSSKQLGSSSQQLE